MPSPWSTSFLPYTAFSWRQEANLDSRALRLLCRFAAFLNFLPIRGPKAAVPRKRQRLSRDGYCFDWVARLFPFKRLQQATGNLLLLSTLPLYTIKFCFCVHRVIITSSTTAWKTLLFFNRWKIAPIIITFQRWVCSWSDSRWRIASDSLAIFSHCCQCIFFNRWNRRRLCGTAALDLVWHELSFSNHELE